MGTKNSPTFGGWGIVFVIALLGFAAVASGQLLIGTTGTYITINTGFQKAPYGRPDAQTVIYCSYENSTTCTKKGSTIPAIISTGTITQTGVFASKGLTLNETGAVNKYPTTGFNLEQGTIEMWINPTSGSGKKHHLFTLVGGKSLNGDGTNEFVMGESGIDETVKNSYIFFGNGNGLNTGTPTTFPSQVVRALSSGDLDGDGDLELIVSNNAANELWIHDGPITEGAILPTPPASKRLAVIEPQGHVVVDLEGDGDLDILAASYASNTNPVFGYKNDGAGNFAPLSFLLGPLAIPAEGIDVSDLDHDGVLDVVFGSFSNSPLQPSMVLYGQINAQGDYTLDITSPNNYQVLDYGILGMTIADLDQDGWDDIVLAATFGDAVIIWMNDATGHFPNDVQHRLTISTSRPFTVAARDIDNDGHLDIGVANYKPGIETNPTSSFLMGPDFASTTNYAVENAVAITVGDLDGDGIEDVAYHSSTGNECPIHFLNVDGSVKQTTTLTCTNTFGSPGGPGSGVYAAVKGSTPYGRNVNKANEMELYYDDEDGMIHFRIYDTYGTKHEVTRAFAPNGNMQKIQAEWNLVKKRLRLIVGNPSSGGGSSIYKAATIITMENLPPIMQIGTNAHNQYSADSTIDEVRISIVERSVGGVQIQ
jgi:hypothetical protein